MTARNINCGCTHNFTCKYCLQNAKPYHYTLNDKSRIYQLLAYLARQDTDILHNTRSYYDNH